MTEYFDGQTSDPRTGIPSVFSDGFRLDELSFSWSEIEKINRVADSWNLMLQGHRLVVSNDQEFISEILPLWIAKQGFFHRLGIHWSSRSILSQILFGIIAVALIISLFYLAFLQIYHLVPPSYDKRVGRKIDEQMMTLLQPCSTQALVGFNRKALQALRKPSDQFATEIIVINNPMVNAFALPGGKIYVFRGILEESKTPDEILGVLAHEIAHVESRHGIQQLIRTMGIGFLSSMVIGVDIDGLDMLQNVETVSEIGSTLLFLRYSRGFEREADLDGVHRMQNAKLPIAGLGELLIRLESRYAVDSGFVWLSTHPKTWERMERYKEIAAATPAIHPNPAFQEERRLWEYIKNSCPEAEDWTKRLKLP